MTDTFEFTLNNPLTEEQWDMIADVDFDRTDRIWFHTKHGKEVAFKKVRYGEWARCVLGSTGGYGTTVMYQCSECESMSISKYRYCPNCGARMEEVNG